MNLHMISTFALAAHWLIVAGLSIRVIIRSDDPFFISQWTDLGTQGRSPAHSILS